MRYLFLMAWVNHSETAENNGEDTLVNSQEDLYPQFLASNAFVFAVEIHAENTKIATAFGYEAAFFHDYTAHDSVSVLLPIEDNVEYPMVSIIDTLA